MSGDANKRQEEEGWTDGFKAATLGALNRTWKYYNQYLIEGPILLILSVIFTVLGSIVADERRGSRGIASFISALFTFFPTVLALLVHQTIAPKAWPNWPEGWISTPKHYVPWILAWLTWILVPLGAVLSGVHLFYNDLSLEGMVLVGVLDATVELFVIFVIPYSLHVMGSGKGFSSLSCRGNIATWVIIVPFALTIYAAVVIVMLYFHVYTSLITAAVGYGICGAIAMILFDKKIHDDYAYAILMTYCAAFGPSGIVLSAVAVRNSIGTDNPVPVVILINLITTAFSALLGKTIELMEAVKDREKAAPILFAIQFSGKFLVSVVYVDVTWGWELVVLLGMTTVNIIFFNGGVFAEVFHRLTSGAPGIPRGKTIAYEYRLAQQNEFAGKTAVGLIFAICLAEYCFANDVGRALVTNRLNRKERENTLWIYIVIIVITEFSEAIAARIFDNRIRNVQEEMKSLSQGEMTAKNQKGEELKVLKPSGDDVEASIGAQITKETGAKSPGMSTPKKNATIPISRSAIAASDDGKNESKDNSNVITKDLLQRYPTLNPDGHLDTLNKKAWNASRATLLMGMLTVYFGMYGWYYNEAGLAPTST